MNLKQKCREDICGTGSKPSGAVYDGAGPCVHRLRQMMILFLQNLEAD